MNTKFSIALILFTIICISLPYSIKSSNEEKHEIAPYTHNSPALLPRQKSPYWSATAVENEKFFKLNSEQYKGKYLVMLFYPFDFSYLL